MRLAMALLLAVGVSVLAGPAATPACEEGAPCPDNAHYEFYRGLDNYVWNNDGDKATLKRPNGTVVDQCAYTSSADSPLVCSTA